MHIVTQVDSTLQHRYEVGIASRCGRLDGGHAQHTVWAAAVHIGLQAIQNLVSKGRSHTGGRWRRLRGAGGTAG